MPTDEELIREVHHGSQAAMEVLVKRHYQTVFAFVYRKFGNYHTACDLTQEVFIRVLNALNRYRENGRFDHWLIKITVNCCRDFVRSRAFAEQAEALAYEDSIMGPNVTSLIEKSVRQQEIRDAIRALPPEQRDAVILYFYNGFRIKEIAQMTGAKEATVKSRLHQAVGKLKKSLYGGEWDAKDSQRV